MNPDVSPWARHDPSAWRRTLAYRPRDELPFDIKYIAVDAALMLDTTVYIDAQKSPGLPGDLSVRIANGVIWHSAVVLAELAMSLGNLDPAHPGTPAIRAALEETLRRACNGQVIPAGASVWIEAAVICGTLTRTQGLAKSDQRKLLNDVLLFLSAGDSGAVLVSRNHRDFDLLLRFRPDVRVLFYDL